MRAANCHRVLVVLSLHRFANHPPLVHATTASCSSSPYDVRCERLLPRHDHWMFGLMRRNDPILISPVSTIRDDFVRSTLRMRDWNDRAYHLVRHCLSTIHSWLIRDLVARNTVWHVNWHPASTNWTHLLVPRWHHLYWDWPDVGRNPFRSHHLVDWDWLGNECLALRYHCRLHVKTWRNLILVN